jgi:hypothetical protein
VRAWNELEVDSNRYVIHISALVHRRTQIPCSDNQWFMCSLERLLDYSSTEQEPKATKVGTPPAYWPASGDLRVEHLSASYSVVSVL